MNFLWTGAGSSAGIQVEMYLVILWWVVILALIVYVGITNVINFMDGINGITAGYSLAVLIPLLLLNSQDAFVESSLIGVSILSVGVFCLFIRVIEPSVIFEAKDGAFVAR